MPPNHFAALAVATVDSWGRRPLLLWGVSGIVVALLLLGTAQVRGLAGWLAGTVWLCYVSGIVAPCCRRALRRCVRRAALVVLACRATAAGYGFALRQAHRMHTRPHAAHVASLVWGCPTLALSC